MEALTFVGLGSRANELISSFSYGHQRLIEIARALGLEPDAAAARRARCRPQLDREARTARAAQAHRGAGPHRS
jgi:ABC-type ATPase involved in cell division